MPFDADDLAAFNDPDMPGYAVATIGGVSIPGRFKANYAEAFGMGGCRPVFSAPIADLDGVVEGTAVVVNGTSYKVDEPRVSPPDMPSHTRLFLTEP